MALKQVLRNVSNVNQALVGKASSGTFQFNSLEVFTKRNAKMNMKMQKKTQRNSSAATQN